MSHLLKNIIQLFTKPLFTLLLFIFTLPVFIYYARHSRFIYDDYYLLAVTTKHSYFESVNYLYFNMNGRWSSNLLTTFIFGAFGCKIYLYWYVHLAQFFLFILSVSFFFRSILQYFGKRVNFLQSLHYGTFFTCLFYWFYFDARIEVWYWEASCLVHLISLICIFFLYGVIFNTTFSKVFKFVAICLLAFFIGGLSESFAFACFIISICVAVRNRQEKNSFTLFHVLVAVFIGLSFCINYFSPATAVRTGYLPEPQVTLGLKNTAYTFYLQAKKIKHLPFKLFGIFLLWPLALLFKKVSPSNQIGFKFNAFDYLIIALLVFENTFLPAFSISQEAPDRTFAFNWLLGLLLVLNYLLKRKPNVISS